MDATKVEQYLHVHKHFFRPEDLLQLRGKLEQMDDVAWRMLFELKLQDPNTVRAVSIFAGPIGIDRFMIGDTTLGVLKTITCGGLMIWAFVDCFVVYKAAQQNNLYKVLHIV